MVVGCYSWKNGRKPEKEKTKMSKDGFVSTAWGPSTWLMIHIVSLNYPVVPSAEDICHYSTWFEHLEFVLPCRACRENFKRALTHLKYDREEVFRSRDTFSRFGHALHEHVSSMLRKMRSTRYEDMVDFYERLRATSCTDIEMDDGCIRSKRMMCNIHFQPVGESGIQINI